MHKRRRAEVQNFWGTVTSDEERPFSARFPICSNLARHATLMAAALTLISVAPALSRVEENTLAAPAAHVYVASTNLRQK